MQSTEKAMAPHSSTLAWKIPWAEEPGRLQSMGSLRVGHNWATSLLLLLFTFTHWRRKWQPTPVFLPGESQEWGESGGLPSMGSHRVGHNWSDLAAAAAAVQSRLWQVCMQSNGKTDEGVISVLGGSERTTQRKSYLSWSKNPQRRGGDWGCGKEIKYVGKTEEYVWRMIV